MLIPLVLKAQEQGGPGWKCVNVAVDELCEKNTLLLSLTDNGQHPLKHIRCHWWNVFTFYLLHDKRLSMRVALIRIPFPMHLLIYLYTFPRNAERAV
jgi:hypothetical protein